MGYSGTIVSMAAVEELDLPLVRVAEAMAECLERFLSASADEPTMLRARAALEDWRHSSSVCAS
jgi:hypothetical protein